MNTATLQSEQARAAFLHFVKNLPLGKGVVFQWKPWAKKRTPSGNAVLHITFRQFGQALGWNEQEAKDYFKEHHGPKVIKTLGGKDLTLPKSTTQYTTKECWDMVEVVSRIGAENGVYIDTEAREA